MDYEYRTIYEHVPVGRDAAAAAAKIADAAGVNRRSCGTKLTAMQRGDRGKSAPSFPGLTSRYMAAKRQRVWWRA